MEDKDLAAQLLAWWAMKEDKLGYTALMDSAIRDEIRHVLDQKKRDTPWYQAYVASHGDVTRAWSDSTTLKNPPASGFFDYLDKGGDDGTPQEKTETEEETTDS